MVRLTETLERCPIWSTHPSALSPISPWKSPWKMTCPAIAGGLGVLAGDTIRAAADIRLPMVAVSLLYRKGFFRQTLGEEGAQSEEPVEWQVEKFLEEETPRVSVTMEGRRSNCEPGATPLSVCVDMKSPSIFWMRTSRRTIRATAN